MNPKTYIAIVLTQDGPTMEHGRITETIRQLSTDVMAPPFGDQQELTFIFNSSEHSTKIHNQLKTACLDGDRFLLVQIAIEDASAASSLGVTRVADWVNKRGIRPRTK